jgi:hypothetical protein
MSYTSLGDTTRETGSTLANIGRLTTVMKLAGFLVFIVRATTLHSTGRLGDTVVVVIVAGRRVSARQDPWLSRWVRPFGLIDGLEVSDIDASRILPILLELVKAGGTVVIRWRAATVDEVRRDGGVLIAARVAVGTIR